MLQLSPKDKAQFNNIFGTHSEQYAKGIEDSKKGAGKKSNDPEYLKGFVHQVKIQAEQENKRG